MSKNAHQKWRENSKFGGEILKNVLRVEFLRICKAQKKWGSVKIFCHFLFKIKRIFLFYSFEKPLNSFDLHAKLDLGYHILYKFNSNNAFWSYEEEKPHTFYIIKNLLFLRQMLIFCYFEKKSKWLNIINCNNILMCCRIH